MENRAAAARFLRGSIPYMKAEPPDGSRSHSKVCRREMADEHHAKLVANVVFPTPPLVL